ncbi:hypothetical protein F4808DRAFT_442215 [Astrocystis sublimbata]|nr:hypothetical protein F4808DRAFT_442215 [Astrocystis sublimbata]
MGATPASSPTQEAVDSATKLYLDIEEVFPLAVDQFESRWTAALAVCHTSSAAETDFADLQTEQFAALGRLGPKIMPLVVYKLARDKASQSPWAVSLYMFLEKDPDYRPALDKDVQACIGRIVELNYQRHEIFKQRAAAWQAYQDMHGRESSSYFFIWCDEFDDLLEMGQSIIAPAMVEYEHHDMFWDTLLHRLLHGRDMDAVQWVPAAVFAWWCYYFEKGEHHQAFKWIPTEFDRKVLGDKIADYH